MVRNCVLKTIKIKEYIYTAGFLILFCFVVFMHSPPCICHNYKVVVYMYMYSQGMQQLEGMHTTAHAACMGACTKQIPYSAKFSRHLYFMIGL